MKCRYSINASLLTLFAYFSIFCLCLTGWIWNIVKLCHAAAFSGMVAARIAGILIPPLGAILGWL